jgi:site-specific DNA-methyltransferase (adenine-specific)
MKDMSKRSTSNTLYTNDNLYVLSGMNSESVDLIYLDPPFNTKRMYSAPVGSKAAGASFKDMWTWQDVDEGYLDSLADNFPALAKYIASVGAIHSKPMMAYLTYMAQRIIEMHRVLKETGSLYLHCDSTASHYLKSLLDSVFGKNNFRNEIVWCYSVGGKTETDDDGRTYRLVYGSKNASGETRYYKYYLDEGKIPEDWWTDINSLQSGVEERTGYPTQKPLALLHRIIKASSHEGDIVLDPFCGCATTCVAAQQLGRKWIGIDIEKQSVKVLINRLSDDAGLFKDFIAANQIPKRSDIQKILPTGNVKQRLHKQQDGKCNACGVSFESRNLEIDHIIPKAKGGGDYYENYQLLCDSCNKIKGDRPMEYLRMKIETRESMMKNKIFFGE